MNVTAHAVPWVLGIAFASAAPRIQLKGIARIDAHATRAAGSLVLSGRITDDTASTAPLRLPPPDGHGGTGGASRSPATLRLTLRFAGTTVGGAATDPDVGHTAPLASYAPEPCDAGGLRPVLEAPDRLLLPTDDAARFCVRLALPVDRYVAHLEMPASDLMDGAHVDLPIDLALATVTLAYDPEVSVLSLDQETTTIDVSASLDAYGSTRGHAAAGVPVAPSPALALALTLSSESGADLGGTTTDAGGRGRIVVPAARMGPPGKGELRLAFAGNSSAAASTRTLGVERHTRVDLSAPDATPDATGGALPPAAVEDGVTVRIVASAECAARGCAVAPTGTVVARAGDGDAESIVGAARLDDGMAKVVVRLAAPGHAAEAGFPLRFRYVPDAPWFEKGADLPLLQPVRPPGPWRTVALVAAGLGVLAWLAMARFPRAADAEASEPRRASEPGPSVALVRPGAAGRWTGQVIDAHEGTAVAGARVAIERPGFEDVRVVAQTSSDASGAFVLASEETAAGDLLVAEGRLHDKVRQPLPPHGEVEVALVQRRRMLLDRLVTWARRKGKPFDARPEPTPGQVRRAAGRLEFVLEQRAAAEEIERWAGAVEHAAFGGAQVDAGAQSAVEALAPSDASKPPPGLADPRPPPRAR